MSLTCLSCLVTFPDADSQRNHYRGDWHRYNLRRKVAGVAPVGEEEYTGRVEGGLLTKLTCLS